MSKLEFIIELPDHSTKNFSLLVGDEITLGRSSSKSSIKVSDELCSGLHLKLSYMRDSLFVEDLKSKNGVYVNDIRVARQRIYHEDKVRFGQTYIYLDPVNNSSEILAKLTKKHELRDPLTGKILSSDSESYLKLEKKRSITKTDIVGRQKAKESHFQNKEDEKNEKRLTEKQIDRLIKFSNFLDYFSTLLVFVLTALCSYLFIHDFNEFVNASKNQYELTTDVYISFAMIFIIPMGFHKINKRLKSGSIGEKLSGYNKHFNY